MNVCPDNINPRNNTNIHRLQVGEKEEDPDWDAPNTASSWHWPNWSTNLEFSLSKCFLLGQFNMANATEWKYELVKITVRSPQKKTLMVVELISASLWGCLACECIIIGMTGRYPAKRLHCCGGGLPWFVASITQTRALTWDVTAVSATCWGSVGQHQRQLLAFLFSSFVQPGQHQILYTILTFHTNSQKPRTMCWRMTERHRQKQIACKGLSYIVNFFKVTNFQKSNKATTQII